MSSSSTTSSVFSIDLIEEGIEIESKLNNLKELAYFAECQYDYHHKNNELDIIKEKHQNLESIEKDCSKFNNEFKSFLETLEDVEMACNDIDRELEKIPEYRQIDFATLTDNEEENKENIRSGTLGRSESLEDLNKN